MQGNESCNLAGCKNFATCEISQVAKLQPADTVHSTTVHPATPVLLHFTHLLFLLQFFVSSYFNPCNSFCFGLFFNFPYTEHLYKPQSVQTLHQSISINKVMGEASSSPAWLLLSSTSLSFIFFPLSRLTNTPLRMTTQRMVG